MIKNRHILNIGMLIMHDWTMSQKLPVNNFEWIEDTSQFNEYIIKSYDEESNEGYFPEVDVQYPEKLHEICNDFFKTIFTRKNET